MVVFMGTRTYGTKTTAFSIFEEMQFAQEEKTDSIFPLKMLKEGEKFEVPVTAVYMRVA